MHLSSQIARIRYAIIALGVLLSIKANTVLADNLGQAQSNLDKVSSRIGGNVEGDISVLVGTVIQAILSLLGLVFFVLVIYAGFLWMTARGDETKVEKSKDILKSSIAGLFIIVSAYAITVFVTGYFAD